jgi:hypothetical protein
MKGLVSLILASVVANGAAVPLDSPPVSLLKRQGKGTSAQGLGALLSGLKGAGGASGSPLGGLLAVIANPKAFGKYMGEPEACK